MNEYEYTQWVRRRIAETKTPELELMLAVGYKEILTELSKRYRRDAVDFAERFQTK